MSSNSDTQTFMASCVTELSLRLYGRKVRENEPPRAKKIYVSLCARSAFRFSCGSQGSFVNVGNEIRLVVSRKLNVLM